MLILNLMWVSKIWLVVVIISGAISIIFFLMSIGRIIHSIWSFHHLKIDWSQIPIIPHRIELKKKLTIHQNQPHLTDWHNHLIYWFWGGLLAILILMVILPILHI